MSLSKDITQVIVTFADGEVRTFKTKGHYVERKNCAQSKSFNSHNEVDEQKGSWTEHEVWWRT